MNKKLFEGIKFGEKEKQSVLDNAHQFRVGIEYEYNPHPHAGGKPAEFEQDANFDTNYDRLVEFMAHNYDMNEDDVYERFLQSDSSRVFENINGEVENIHLYHNYVNTMQRIASKLSDIEQQAPKDTETEDMFGDEGKFEGYQRVVREALDDHGSDKELKVSGTFLDDLSITEFVEICYIYDMYYAGAYFKADDKPMTELYRALEMVRTLGDNLDSSQIDDEELDGAKVFMDFVRYLSKSSIASLPSEDDLPHAIQRIDSGTALSPREIAEYEEEYGVVDFLDKDWYVYLSTEEDLEVVHDMLSTEPLEEYGVNTNLIREIKEEHHGMVEVITEVMTVGEALKNMEEMFDYMRNSAEVHDFAGMHISISSAEHHLDDFKLMKFVTLLDLPHILEQFPEREYVLSLQDKVETAIEKYLGMYMLSDLEHEESMVAILNDAMNYAKEQIEDDKEQSIKFGDYRYLNGRIELRFFGGEDYHERMDTIKTHLFRALYLLTFAYTDEHEKVYRKKMIKMVDGVIKENIGMSYSRLYNLMTLVKKKYPEDDLEDIVVDKHIFDDEKKKEISAVLLKVFKTRDTIDRVKRFFR